MGRWYRGSTQLHAQFPAQLISCSFNAEPAACIKRTQGRYPHSA